MARISRRKLAELVADRLVAGEDRAELLKAVAAYLIEHKAVKQTELLAADVALVLAERRQHVAATIRTARPLGEELQRSLKQYIAKQTDTDSIELQEKIEPELIGGAIIETPGLVQDASIRSQLRALQV